MPNQRIRPPRRLLIAAVILVIFGILYALLIVPALSPETLRDGIFFGAIPFLAIFIGILLAYIYSIFVAASRLNGVIPRRVHRPIELLIIGGILLGVVGMFQPWIMAGYTYGFLLLLISTLAFIAWSHITPASSRAGE